MPIMLFIASNPFAKGETYYSQVVLGFPFAWAIGHKLYCFACGPIQHHLLGPAMALFAASVLWAIIYDTTNAHQDIKDDVNTGMKSMAVRIANRTKLITFTLVLLQFISLMMPGWLAGRSISHILYRH